MAYKPDYSKDLFKQYRSKTMAKEYRFFKNKNGRYNILKEFGPDVQYGSGIKTLCAVLDTE